MHANYNSARRSPRVLRKRDLVRAHAFKRATVQDCVPGETTLCHHVINLVAVERSKVLRQISKDPLILGELAVRRRKICKYELALEEGDSAVKIEIVRIEPEILRGGSAIALSV